MCGLAGYSGIDDSKTRLSLAHALGLGIDTRGGHAAGFISVAEGGAITMSKRIGRWQDAKPRFLYAASSGHVSMMHARYATCGSRTDPNHAHPFAVKRDGKTVLYGSHNGVISGTHTTAREHGREHTVDSKEVFELLADGKLDVIKTLTGYGVLTWVVPGSSDVSVARLSDNSDIVIVGVVGGGVVWGSTRSIVDTALLSAGLQCEETFIVDVVGQVYTIRCDGVYIGTTSGLTVGSSYSGGMYGWDVSDYSYPRDGRAKRKDTAKPTYTYNDRLFDLAADMSDSAEEWERMGRWQTPTPFVRIGETFTGADGVEWVRMASGWEKTPEVEQVPSSMGSMSAMIQAGVNDELCDTLPSMRAAPSVTIDGDTVNLDNLTDEQLDSISEEQWEELVNAYRTETY